MRSGLLFGAAAYGMWGLVWCGQEDRSDRPAGQRGIEAGVAAPFALIYVVLLQATDHGTFTDHGAGHVVLMILAGVLTVLPLLLFAAAAQRLAMISLGLLFYITPAMQLTWGVLGGHESMPPARWVGFGVRFALFRAGRDTRRDTPRAVGGRS